MLSHWGLGAHALLRATLWTCRDLNCFVFFTLVGSHSEDERDDSKQHEKDVDLDSDSVVIVKREGSLTQYS